MTVNQQWIRDVFADDACFIDVNIIDVIHQVDSSTLARIRRFHDPDVFLALVLLELLVVVVEVTELVRQDVGVG